MENFFGLLALAVVSVAFPGGFWLARRCVKNIAGRVLLTLLFGAAFIVVGVIAVVAGCSAVGGKMDFR